MGLMKRFEEWWSRRASKEEEEDFLLAPGGWVPILNPRYDLSLGLSNIRSASMNSGRLRPAASVPDIGVVFDHDPHEVSIFAEAGRFGLGDVLGGADVHEYDLNPAHAWEVVAVKDATPFLGATPISGSVSPVVVRVLEDPSDDEVDKVAAALLSTLAETHG